MRRFLSLAALSLVLATALPTGTRAEPVTGAGSTFVAPLMARWSERFRFSEADGGDFPSPEGGVDYEVVGSLAGTMRVIHGAVDFGATDAPLKEADLDRFKLAQFPIVMGGVAVVVNLPGLEGKPLRLTGTAIADIYLGKIARWNDPALTATNPDTALPDRPISVLRRADGSGTTFNFAGYLAGASTEWREKVGVDTELKWPVGVGVRGNEALANAVKATPFAIGYVEYGQAQRAKLPMAEVQNRAGTFVAPSPDSFAAAANSADWTKTKHFDLVLNAVAGPEAYPIAATVFALVPRAHSTGRSRRAFRLFNRILTRWQADALELGYVPLPVPVVEQVKAYWAGTLGIKTN